MGGGNRGEETYNKYGDEEGVDIGDIKNMGFRGNSFSGSTGRRSLAEGRFVYTVGNKSILAGHAKIGGHKLAKI